LVQFGAEGRWWHAVEAPERAGEVRRLAVADLSRYVAHRDRGKAQKLDGGFHASPNEVVVERTTAELSVCALDLAGRCGERPGEDLKCQGPGVMPLDGETSL
jgi:hypothetical protein